MQMKRTMVLGIALGLLVGCTEKAVEKIDTRPLVRVCVVTNGVSFADALAVQGTVRAKDVAKVAARLPGTIDEICVEEGAAVRQGEVLFKVDQVNLANAVRAAEDDLAMAKARLAQSEAAEAKAKLDLGRMTRLLAEKAVTRDAFEKTEVAAKSHAAAFDAAKAMVTKATTGLSVARKNLSDSEVRAPFDAIVTKKSKNAGDYAAPGATVFELENPATYELCLSLNSAHYAQVSIGRTEIEIDAIPPPSRFAVTYKAPAVDPLTRTFEVRAVVPKSSAIAAGMILDGRIVFARREGQAVPATAVADRGGECVFAVRDGRAVRVPVEAGLSADGFRELVAPTLSPTERIIAEGQLLVNEGAEVRVINGSR